MLIIDSPYLSDSVGDYRAIATEIHLAENNFATLVTIDYGSSESSVVKNTGGEIPLSENWRKITAVSFNGQTLIPAINPVSPQPGEFLHNPYTNTIQIFPA